MNITINISEKTQLALQAFIADRRDIDNFEQATNFLLQKALNDLGFNAKNNQHGTMPNNLNSSNDD